MIGVLGESHANVVARLRGQLYREHVGSHNTPVGDADGLAAVDHAARVGVRDRDACGGLGPGGDAGRQPAEAERDGLAVVVDQVVGRPDPEGAGGCPAGDGDGLGGEREVTRPAAVCTLRDDGNDHLAFGIGAQVHGHGGVRAFLAGGVGGSVERNGHRDHGSASYLVAGEIGGGRRHATL